ncbi:MAG: leucine-rich repeat protein [Verrucomicrobiota bacterium]
MDTNNLSYSSVAGVLFNRSMTALVAYPGGRVGSYTIPAGVSSIEDGAFAFCLGLTSVSIPATVTSIRYATFALCASLSSMTIPNSVTNIGIYAFSACSSLTNVSIPNNVTDIGESAFQECASLASVMIGNGVTSIGHNVFERCPSLTSVTIPASVTSLGIDAFHKCISLAGVYFQGNAPSVESSSFNEDNNATVYYLPGTTGWSTTFGGRPTVMLATPMLTMIGRLQVGLSGTAGIYCDIEKSTNLMNWTFLGRALVGAVLDIGQLDPAWHASSRGFFRAKLASSQQNLPPTITSQPVGVAVSAGESANFVVAATGSLPLQYQWQVNGTNIVGATNANIVFTNLQPSQAGLYSVVITNVADGVTSVGARLSIYSGVPLGDDFNGPTKDTSKWGPDLDLEPGGGQLVQTNGHLQFLGGGSVARPWIGRCGSYTQDWQVAADVHLGNVALTQDPSHVQVFLAVSNPQDTNVMMYGLPGDNFSIALDLYRDPLGASERSYETYFYTNWGEIPPRATTVTASLGGNLRIEFDSTAKTLSAYYDGNLLRTVNIAQAGSSWEMNDASTFMFSLGVGSGGCTLNSSDQVYVDNFLLYGSVPPPVGDDFNSPAEDPNKWGPDIIASPGGQLVRTNGQVQFLGQGSIAKPWVGSYGSYTQNWELILDVNLGNVTLTQDNALIRVGLGLGSSVGPVMPDGSPANKLGLGLGLARVAGLSYRVFGADIYTNGAVAIENLALTTNQHGSVRVSFDAATKTLTSWYAASGDTGAHHWTALKAQQINLPPVNWGMTDNSTFLLALTADCNGYTLNSSDQVYADNFLIYGSVPAPPPYTWTTNSGTITITRYTGPGGAVAIPSMITGLPVTSIGNMAFRSCTSLASVTIPISVTNIGYAPFLYCDSLTAITVDTNNPAYSSAGGVLFNKSQSTLVQHPPGKAGSYTIPDSVTSIGDGSFIDCTGLTNIAIPPSVTSIGDSAFFGCSGLLSIAIPTNLTNIGYDVFVDCTSLSVIAVNPSNSVYSSVDGVLFNKSQTTLIQYPAGKSRSSYTIPTGVISIGDSAFWGCISLASVVIPDSVTRIGDEAFGLCQSLTSITLGTKVTSIGVGAFEYCFNLATVTIPSSVTMIGVNAFYDCDSLTKVYFQGNAPLVYLNQLPCCGGEPTVFDNGHNGTGHDPTTVYYLPGTSEWSSTFSGIPTALWFLPNPLILEFEPSFGVQSNGFSFIISWATNIPVVVEACTNLANSAWSPVGTNTLTDGSYYFSDPQWTNYARRFYRLRSP